MLRIATQSLLVTALLLAGIAIAQQPAQNIDAKQPPNLAAAQRSCEEAYQKVVAAQQANEKDMQGHAEKAKQLLAQASQELKQAAEADDKAHPADNKTPKK